MLVSELLLMARSFTKQTLLVDTIEEMLDARGIGFDADCGRYKLPDPLFFNTPYHLVKEGVDERTKLVIEDLTRLRLLGETL